MRTTCAGWSGPTATSYLCNEHFTDDCFKETSVMAANLGIRKLKLDAVPTVFERNVMQKAAPPPSKRRAASCSTEQEYSQAAKKSTGSAFEKR